MAKLVDKEKKRNWKLNNEYYSFVACMTVVFTIFIDFVHVLGIEKLEKIFIGIAVILIMILLRFNKKFIQIFDRISNKELLSNIINLWSTLGIIIFIIEKVFLQLIDISDGLEKIIVIALFAIIICGGIISIVINVKKKEWKYKVDL